MGRKQSNHRKTKQFYAERFCLSKTCELYTTCMFFSIYLSFHSAQGTKIFKYCTCPAGRVTNNCHSFCKHKHLSFKSLCNKEHKGVICNMTSSSDSFLKKELLVLSRFHSYLRAPPPPPLSDYLRQLKTIRKIIRAWVHISVGRSNQGNCSEPRRNVYTDFCRKI